MADMKISPDTKKKFIENEFAKLDVEKTGSVPVPIFVRYCEFKVKRYQILLKTPKRAKNGSQD